MKLGAHDVHVWQVDLCDDAGDLFIHVLSHDEHARAQNFRTRELQLHYRRCRSALRTLLAGYTQQPASDLRFEYNRFGKPGLVDQACHFNVSHSGARALIAIARQPVGVDLEMLDKSGIEADELAGLVCHSTEKAALEKLPAAERTLLFYRLWTRKEAYCKALSVGLQHALSALHLQTLPASTIAQVIDEQADKGSAYFVHDLPVIPGYEASPYLPAVNADIYTFAYRGRCFI